MESRKMAFPFYLYNHISHVQDIPVAHWYCIILIPVFRALFQDAIKCTRHAKRTVLTADDVDSALSLRNVEVPFLRTIKNRMMNAELVDN
jgi:hypothetical protein